MVGEEAQKEREKEGKWEKMFSNAHKLFHRVGKVYVTIGLLPPEEEVNSRYRCTVSYGRSRGA